MKWLNPLILFLFLVSALNLNPITSFIALFLILLIVSLKSPKSLRFTGGLRFWIFPLIFLVLISFKYPDPVIEKTKFVSNIKIFLHLYVFSVLINLINDNIKLNSVYSFFDKYGLTRLKFVFVFALAVMKKMIFEMKDIFFFYRLNNRGLKFFIKIYMLIYVIIRNSVKICYDMTEVFYLRGLYEK